MGQDQGDIPYQVREESQICRTRRASRPRDAASRRRSRAGPKSPSGWQPTPKPAQAVQDNAKRKVDIIKIWVDDRDNKFKKLTPELYGAVIDEAHKNGLRVTAHIYELTDAKGCSRRVSTRSRTVSATATSTRSSWRCSRQRPEVILVPNLPIAASDRSELGAATPFPPASCRSSRPAATDGPRRRSCSASRRATCEAQRGGCQDCDGHRRQHAVRAAPRDGGHGGGRHDAGPGHRRGHAEFRRGHAAHRPRHGRRRARAPISSCSTPIRWTTSPIPVGSTPFTSAAPLWTARACARGGRPRRRSSAGRYRLFRCHGPQRHRDTERVRDIFYAVSPWLCGHVEAANSLDGINRLSAACCPGPYRATGRLPSRQQGARAGRASRSARV